jgi:TrmH family RNA methyltransferase
MLRESRLPVRRPISVILSKPEQPDNLGLVARAMKNTGFQDLRLVGLSSVPEKAFSVAVHSQDILRRARLLPSLEEATADLNLVLAGTVRFRKDFISLSLEEAVRSLFRFPVSTRLGLLFGNERTGLSREELRRTNACFVIPQAVSQPSYNLAAAVLLTLYAIFDYGREPQPIVFRRPLPRPDQEECIGRICLKLEEAGFIHDTNRRQLTDRIHGLFGRMALAAEDKALLLAIFTKGLRPSTTERREHGGT